ncbi:hypothetical protein FACS189473_5230 [Spirochaetia bacterium]|nr:hypothetical protein FACS189473_5230 [Spirochaetia bacterium]
MKETPKNDEYKSFRCSQADHKAISAKATRLHCSESDVIRSALNDYLYNEVNTNNLIIESLPKIMRILESIQRNVKDLHSLWNEPLDAKESMRRFKKISDGLRETPGSKADTPKEKPDQQCRRKPKNSSSD